jgi:hypothetical protein
MTEKQLSRAAKIAATVAQVVGYLGLGVYAYWGIIKGHDVSEMFLIIIALLVRGDAVLKFMESKKK